MRNAFFVNNISGKEIPISDLNIILPVGIFDLFDLNNNLTQEKVQYSFQFGALSHALRNGLCRLSSDISNVQAHNSNVIIRRPLPIQILPSRIKFTNPIVEEKPLFDDIENSELFKDEEIKSARELAEELKHKTENVEAIEATIKKANLPEKPLENRYINEPEKKNQTIDEKLKNDIEMGYITCSGFTAKGTRCKREVVLNRLYCGLHGEKKKKK